MGKILRKEYVVLLGASLLTGGCSFFSAKPDAQNADSRSFRATASAETMSMPLPVEIADDIKTIAAGGQVKSQSAWQKTEPEIAAEAESTEETASEPTSARTRRPASRRAPAKAGRKGGGTETYVVKPGDTLMKISFEKYGNLYRWREILDTNRDKIANFNSLPIGAVLEIQGVEYVVIERNGKPYLIRRGDTLVRISRGLYGTPTHWRHLWDNNRQMIRDPNKIYAGFTLYYQDQPSSVRNPLTKRSTSTKRVPASPKK